MTYLGTLFILTSNKYGEEMEQQIQIKLVSNDSKKLIFNKDGIEQEGVTQKQSVISNHFVLCSTKRFLYLKFCNSSETINGIQNSRFL